MFLGVASCDSNYYSMLLIASATAKSRHPRKRGDWLLVAELGQLRGGWRQSSPPAPELPVDPAQTQWRLSRQNGLRATAVGLRDRLSRASVAFACRLSRQQRPALLAVVLCFAVAPDRATVRTAECTNRGSDRSRNFASLGIHDAQRNMAWDP